MRVNLNKKRTEEQNKKENKKRCMCVWCVNAHCNSAMQKTRQFSMVGRIETAGKANNKRPTHHRCFKTKGNGNCAKEEEREEPNCRTKKKKYI